MYKISVIVPVYNVENYLKQCLDSIVNQTMKEIEIICINDGSNDSSKSILDKYQKNDERIIVINRANRGYGAACNYGLKLARGKYCAIVEPDDFIDIHMYEEMYDLAETHNTDIVKSSFFESSDALDKDTYPTVNKIKWDNEYFMPTSVFKITEYPQFIYFHPSIWSCLFKTEFLRKNNISFIEAKGAGWVDNPFQVQTFCMAEKIYYTNNAYYYYRLTNPSSSSNIVNISNPFDRSDEIYSFLNSSNITNENILAHLYKREMGYIDIVLAGIASEYFDYACKRILNMVSHWDENIIYKNKFITLEEREKYESCKTTDSIKMLMNSLKQQKNSKTIVNFV